MFDPHDGIVSEVSKNKKFLTWMGGEGLKARRLTPIDRATQQRLNNHPSRRGKKVGPMKPRDPVLSSEVGDFYRDVQGATRMRREGTFNKKGLPRPPQSIQRVQRSEFGKNLPTTGFKMPRSPKLDKKLTPLEQKQVQRSLRKVQKSVRVVGARSGPRGSWSPKQLVDIEHGIRSLPNRSTNDAEIAGAAGMDLNTYRVGIKRARKRTGSKNSHQRTRAQNQKVLDQYTPGGQSLRSLAEKNGVSYQTLKNIRHTSVQKSLDFSEGVTSAVSKMGPDQSELHVVGNSGQRRKGRLRKLPPDAVRRK